MTGGGRTTRLCIVPARLGGRGQFYDIRLGAPDGEHLGMSRTPFYDGARLLLFRGITGRFEMWGPERPYPCVMGDIETCAGLTVRETERDGPRIVAWKPFPAAAAGEPQSAMEGQAATILPADETA